MKWVSIIAAYVTVCVAFAADYPGQDKSRYFGVPFHPYRRVANHYYSLLPLYKWLDLPSDKREAADRPMTEWQGGPGRHFRILSVVQGKGVLLESRRWGDRFSSPSYELYGFLINFPYNDVATDNEEIQFLATRTGTYQYESADGSTRTVPLYDYGIPYDPFKLAADLKRTNAPKSAP